MATYNIENQWGGNNAPWNRAGVFVLGSRDDKLQNVVALKVASSDGGQTLEGSTTYAGEGPIGFRAKLMGNNTYDVVNQWGGNNAPWHPGGRWVIGTRQGQGVVAVDISSTDGGKTFGGTMTYAGEGPIGVKAGLVGLNVAFNTQNQWGGNNAPWHEGGIFVLGARPTQNLISLDVSSKDGGKTLQGSMSYAGEGPIGFRATQDQAGNYRVENQWGGNNAPWHPGGNWLIGFRAGKQNVVALRASSTDGGKTLTGALTYAGEGPIGFKATSLGARK